jgi:putative ABC transport system ATP-binding protein
VAEDAIALQDVVFRWRPALAPCLDIVEFRLAAGERVFLHGPSGSGKSSLLSLIGGVTVPERGQVSVLGTDMVRLPGAARDRFRADHLGFLFQLFNLIPYLSALENILLPCRFSVPRRAAAEAAGGSARDEARRLARQLDLAPELLEHPAAELSVGQQQRVAAARALIGGPRVVIADEPTSALDAEREQAFLDLLLAECARRDATVLLVSHDVRLADRFDRGVALADINRASVDRDSRRPSPI